MPARHMTFTAMLLCAASPFAAQSVAAQDASDRAVMGSFAEDRERDALERDASGDTAQAVRRSAPQSVQTGGRQIEVNSVLIEGNEALPDSEFLDLIAAYSARSLSEADLAALVDAVANRARDAGYIFATATVPRQSLSMGILRVRLDEGAVGVIRIEGADEPAIRRQLAPLMDGNPITRDRLERQLLLADDISGVRILDSRFEREDGVGVLIVKTRRSHASASVELRNNGSQPVGPYRARIDVDFNGVFDSADEIDITIGTTPFQPSELQIARGSYRIVVDSSGLELGTHLSYSSTEPGDFLADSEIGGEFWRIGIDAQYPVIRRRDFSVWVIGEFEVSDLKQNRAGELVRHDRVPAIRAGLYSRGRLAGGQYRGRVMVSRGLDIFSATQLGDPLASRDDASVDFTSIYGWLAWDRPLSRSLSVTLGARGQLASDPLLTTEDIGLGGTSFLRGYNFNERSGDRGIMGFGELSYNWRGEGFWMPRAQVYVFADGGHVSNLGDGFGGGSLASAGGGLRLDVTRDLDLDLELAVPLTGERFDSDSDAPLINLRVEQSF